MAASNIIANLPSVLSLAACRLHFVSAAKGSLDLLAEISDIDHLAERCAAGALGEQALNSLEKTSAAIARKDEQGLRAEQK